MGVSCDGQGAGEGDDRKGSEVGKREGDERIKWGRATAGEKGEGIGLWADLDRKGQRFYCNRSMWGEPRVSRYFPRGFAGFIGGFVERHEEIGKGEEERRPKSRISTT